MATTAALTGAACGPDLTTAGAGTPEAGATGLATADGLTGATLTARAGLAGALVAGATDLEAGFATVTEAFLADTSGACWALDTGWAAALAGEDFAATDVPWAAGLATALEGALATTGAGCGVGSLPATLRDLDTFVLADALLLAPLGDLAAFTGELAEDFAETIALTDFSTGFELAFSSPLLTLALESLPDLAFTSGLLAERGWSRSFGLTFPLPDFFGTTGGVSPARECTGLPIGKPISCKIETIIPRSARIY